MILASKFDVTVVEQRRDEGEMPHQQSPLRREQARAEPEDEPTVEPELVREALARLLASDDFDASERNRRFLSFVVEETLAGRGERLKGYAIALSVFDRDETFDPQTEPIVRIEASRLRRSLERYYLLAGQSEPVRIEIPKGGYAAIFHHQGGSPPAQPAPPAPSEAPATPLPPDLPPVAVPEPARLRPHLLGQLAIAGAAALVWLSLGLPGGEPEQVAPEPATTRQGPAILVAPFEDEGPPAAFNFGRGFTREVIAGLTRFNDLLVFGAGTTFQQEPGGGLREAAAQLGVDFILGGGVSSEAGAFGITATLMDARSGQYVWSGHYDGSLAPDQLMAARDSLADQVARTLAQPYGVIYHREMEAIEDKPPQSLSAYGCVLRFYDYWKTYNFAQLAEVRQCLERAIVAEPGYGDAHAALAMVYIDAYRYRQPLDGMPPDPRARALELALRAVELAPASTHSYQALHLAYWFMNDVERSLQAAERGLALNPNDSDLMADLGLRYCLRARWEEGVPLVEQAYARNPGQPGQYRIALFLYHYVNGRYDEALAEAHGIGAPEVVYQHIALAMAYARLDRQEEAQAALGQVLAIDPAYGERVVADLQGRNLDPGLIETVVAGLREAGLEIPVPLPS